MVGLTLFIMKIHALKRVNGSHCGRFSNPRNAPGSVYRCRPVSFFLIAISLLLSSCHRSDDRLVQGYVEGEFVYVASPMSGALQSLSVARGAQVREGAPLFILENGWIRSIIVTTAGRPTGSEVECGAWVLFRVVTSHTE